MEVVSPVIAKNGVLSNRAMRECQLLKSLDSEAMLDEVRKLTCGQAII